MMSRNISALGLSACLFAAGSAVSATGPEPGVPFRLLSDFATPAATAEEFADIYFGKTTESAADSCFATVSAIADDQADFARMRFSLAPTASTPWYANVGLTLPLDNLWSIDNDLRSMKYLKFKARSSSEQILKIYFSSPALPFETGGYTPLKMIAVSEEWAWYQIKVSDFRYPQWMKDDAKKGVRIIDLRLVDAEGVVTIVPTRITWRAVEGRLLNVDSASSVDFDNDSINVLKHVGTVSFGIEPIYDASTIEAGTVLDPEYALTVRDAFIDIDSVLFEGAGDVVIPPENDSLACQQDPYILEDFSPAKLDLRRNYLGGGWYAHSDTNSDPAHQADSGVGVSRIVTESDWPWGPDADRRSAELVADLSRGDVFAHPYAGWAEMGTEIPSGVPGQKGRNLSGLKGVSFSINAGGYYGRIFDSSIVKGAIIKVGKASIPDAVSYESWIPLASMGRKGDSRRTFCLDVSKLRQPSWFEARAGHRDFVADDVTAIAWRLSLMDRYAVAANTSAIEVADVRLWGLPTVGIERPASRPARGALRACYRGELTLSYSLPGTGADIEIIGLDGSRIASFRAGAKEASLRKKIPMRPGTYLVVAKGDGAREVGVFAVLPE